jgi:DNA-binding NarL/FixJ family response regulator
MIEDNLTGRELQVAGLIAEGYEYTEIGRMLGTRPQTVKNQASTIYRKLNLHDGKRRPSILLTRLVMREQMG